MENPLVSLFRRPTPQPPRDVMSIPERPVSRSTAAQRDTHVT